jgi:ligand-binding SRPBCC domain-containing protein
MPLEKFERQQIIPITLTQAWSFFGRPENLADITPPSLGFRVTSSPQGPMYPGMILTLQRQSPSGATAPLGN